MVVFSRNIATFSIWTHLFVGQTVQVVTDISQSLRLAHTFVSRLIDSLSSNLSGGPEIVGHRRTWELGLSPPPRCGLSVVDRHGGRSPPPSDPRLSQDFVVNSFFGPARPSWFRQNGVFLMVTLNVIATSMQEHKFRSRPIVYVIDCCALMTW